MTAETDYDFTPDQWEALKALRTPVAKRRFLNRFVVEQLVALRLVVVVEDYPVITSAGRSALLRGSPRLWDVAA
jgi:hypothetical protein